MALLVVADEAGEQYPPVNKVAVTAFHRDVPACGTNLSCATIASYMTVVYSRSPESSVVQDVRAG
jgi:hypothetical protein